jgi:ferritin
MITPQLIDSLQSQMNKERMNNAQYSAFAAALDAANWPGYSHFMQKASEDEATHAKKFQDFLIDRNQVPIYSALSAPIPLAGDNPIPFFESALLLEQENTISILAIDAIAESDPQTEVWLIWAIEEQTNSERELTDCLLELRRCKGSGLLILDREYLEK